MATSKPEIKAERVERAKESRPISYIVYPFKLFARMEASGGIMLIVAAVLALIWANSPWEYFYEKLFHTQIQMGFGENFSLDYALHHWINDGLMAVFFFVVGLEIKREIIVGELSTRRKAVVPIAAAFGGMIFPALIYVAVNWNSGALHGWGVPMATDIAFALGILALLGRRVAPSLSVFLAALAIVDDIGAVLVIAFFYTSDLNFIALAFGGGFLVLMIVLNLLHVRSPYPYALIGFFLWLSFLLSGVHATIAGVLAAFTIPSRALINTTDFMKSARYLLGKFEKYETTEGNTNASEEQLAAVRTLENTCETIDTPLNRLEENLLPLVTFFILPVFALANAGVKISPEFLSSLLSPVTFGIVLGLFFGKQVGIMLTTWLVVRLGASLPKHATWRQVYGVSCIAGVGFTMALFIAGLAFPSAAHLDMAKAAILIASLFSGVVGFIVLRTGKSYEDLYVAEETEDQQTLKADMEGE